MAQAYGENERLSKLLKPAPPRQESFRDYTREQYRRLKAQDQGINPTGDEALPIMYGPLLANIARAGLSRTIATRPPSPGTKRLWRGEGKPSHQKNVKTLSVENARKKPPQFRSGQEEEWINKADAANRWYGGPTKKEVKLYLDDAYDPRLRYTDVPKSIADKYHLPNMTLKPGGRMTPHNPRAWSGNPTQEWYFPPEADAILRSSKLYRPPLAPFQPSSTAPALMESMILREDE